MKKGWKYKPFALSSSKGSNRFMVRQAHHERMRRHCYEEGVGISPVRPEPVEGQIDFRSW
jgi:hypothetical protein